MKNRASSHLFALLLIIGFEIVGYWAVYRSGLLRGYEPSIVGAVRDLLMFVPVIFLVFFLTRASRFAGNWTLYTTAILLFSIGLLVQYRLYSDPEYNARNKAQARAEKTQTLRVRFINQYYDEEKRRLMGLSANDPSLDPTSAGVRRANYTVFNALTSSYTWITLFSFFMFAAAYVFCLRDSFLQWIQRNSFLIVLVTLVPFVVAIALSNAGKVGQMTPWELFKIPFLLGFAGILTALYRNLAQTYWGVPRARDVIPLLVMAAMPFIPFFALKDFGQMMVFSGAYATLYLIAVRRWPQLLLFIGTVGLGVTILVVGALPRETQERVPTLATLASPVQAILPDRIKQRFHLWIDGFNPPAPDEDWWSDDYRQAIARDPEMRELAQQSPAMQRVVNVDIWFDRAAFQPAQATYGIAAGGSTGRGLGLGFAELIPVADSDYIYAAIAEEFGLAGGAIILLAIIVFVYAGMRTSLDARDMFTKLCAAGLTAFIGFQALVNIGGVTRALPMTGITLPFVSHGGFSLITSFAMLGMLMAFSHRNTRDAMATQTAARNADARRVATGDDEGAVIPEAVQ
jgi:cell division protein FtsW (lipid II flippase)